MDFKTDDMNNTAITVLLSLGSLLISYAEILTVYMRLLLITLSLILVILQIKKHFKTKNTSKNE